MFSRLRSFAAFPAAALLGVGLGAFALSAAPTQAETITIHMKMGPPQYDPKTKTVKVGDTVEWISDAGQHTATPDAGQPDPFLKSPVLTPGQKYSVLIGGSARTIKYHCDIHGAGMAGELVITP